MVGIGMVGKIERASYLRADVERFIRKVLPPMCPYKNKPCINLERGCSESKFGVAAADGVLEDVWRCPYLDVDKPISSN